MTVTDAYRGRRPLKARFWLRLALETFGGRQVAPLVSARMRGERLYHVAGLQHIPTDGAFVLAVNHFSGRAAFDTGAAVVASLGQIRPDAIGALTIVLGQRRALPQNPVQKIIFPVAQGILRWIFTRWQANAVRIPLKNPAPDAAGLREWRARRQPVFVFPEGRASIAFRAIRRGAGRWLASLEMPVVPVGVWWKNGEGWSVAFGAPLVWTPRPDLRDVQLGLSMAALLPEALALDWQADLARWRAAHQTA